ncbi:MAG: type II secretion system secretin GspD [Deltaproteobacteria bacterium]|nr:type II secretion system secretin GspD [Deltaproteobacteria bacterium]
MIIEVKADTVNPIMGSKPREGKAGSSFTVSEEAVKIKPLPEDSSNIVFNFENADLYEVIKTVAEILNISYIVDPKVAGKVTIHTEGGLKKEDIFPIFLQLLDVNGLTAVREGSLYRINYLKDAPRMALSMRSDYRDKDGVLSEDAVIQIIPLKYISAQEMAKLLAPFITQGGIIIAEAASNSLLVVDRNTNMHKVLKLVEAFDINLFAKVMHRFYFLENMDAEEMVKVLGEVLPVYLSARKAEVKFIAIKRLNTVLAVGQDSQIFDKVADIISQLDVVDQEVDPKIYVYFVKNGHAGQLAEILQSVFGAGPKKSEKPKTESGSPLSRNPLSAKSLDEAKAKEEKKEPEKEPLSVKSETAAVGETGRLRGEIKITADEIRNALIIEAVPSDYRIVEDVLRRIDILPRQVLIEATIAEITLDDESSLGIEWSYTKGGTPGSGLLSAAMGESGLTYSIGIANRVKADLSAFAKDNKVNILSSPHILASDNKEAKIDISNEIPVASSNYEYTSTDNPVVATNIQYRDTGVILSVTPHINERGLVTMEISQEVSEVSSNVKVAGKEYPSFYKRNIATTLTVQHGQTIVIGGLIKENRSDTAQGTPCLVSIPVIRYLFGKDSKEFHKTELIVLITPRVVVDLEDVDEVTGEFKKKVDNVIKIFQKYTH